MQLQLRLAWGHIMSAAHGHKLEVEEAHVRAGAALPLDLLAEVLAADDFENAVVIPYKGHLHLVVPSIGSDPEWVEEGALDFTFVLFALQCCNLCLQINICQFEAIDKRSGVTGVYV